MTDAPAGPGVVHCRNMPDLQKAIQDLKTSLGDHTLGGRRDGVFFAQVGGPGAVPPLAGVDVPEIHLDLLPGQPTDEQQVTLRKLGYAEDGASWWHPDGWRLVFPDHETGWRADQHALSEYLKADAQAAQQYRAVFHTQGREAADAALMPAATAHHAATVGFRPAEFAAHLLAPLDAPWMFAAGMALDLHLGRTARAHDDLDIIIPRTPETERALQALLKDWDVKAAVNGAYAAWEVPLPHPHHQIHARHPKLPDVIMLDFMLTDLSADTWHYRRDPAITLPLSEARRVTPGGLPYLAPHAALLFKSATAGGQPRPKDEADFRRVLPTLTGQEKDWLARRIAQASPDHAWLSSLGEPNPPKLV